MNSQRGLWGARSTGIYPAVLCLAGPPRGPDVDLGEARIACTQNGTQRNILLRPCALQHLGPSAISNFERDRISVFWGNVCILTNCTMAASGNARATSMQPISAGDVEDLDMDMVALLSEYGVSQESMRELAGAECSSVCLFAALADDREGVRKAIKNLIGLDPANGKAETIEMAKIVAAWKTSNIRSEVVVKANAEREAKI